jgi:hypothetical protein
MAAQGNIFGISAGGAQSVVTVDLTTANQIAAANLIELRILNKNIVAIGSGQVVTDDPNVDRLDAANNGLYANPPVLPSPGQ